MILKAVLHVSLVSIITLQQLIGMEWIVWPAQMLIVQLPPGMKKGWNAWLVKNLISTLTEKSAQHVVKILIGPKGKKNA